MRTLHPLRAAQVEDSCGFLIVCCGDWQIIKCCKVPPHDLELRRAGDAREDFLTNRANKHCTHFLNKL